MVLVEYTHHNVLLVLHYTTARLLIQSSILGTGIMESGGLVLSVYMTRDGCSQ
jgi:hypothetical protein